MSIVYPCKDCEERYLGCHSKCEKYKECSEKSHRLSSQRIDDQLNRGDVINAMRRMQKRRHLK